MQVKVISTPNTESYSSNGTTWSNGLEFVNSGGTHEQNPFEGIPVSFDGQGTPNLVEEGEVIWNGEYVFSNRLKVPKAFKIKYKIGNPDKNQTYAEIVREIQDKQGELVNDPIMSKTLNANLERLRDSQEEVRTAKEERDARREFNAMSPEEQQSVVDAAAQEQLMQPQAMMSPEGVNNDMMDMTQEPMLNNPPLGDPMTPQGQIQPQRLEQYAYGGNLFDKGGKTDTDLLNEYKDQLRRFRQLSSKKNPTKEEIKELNLLKDDSVLNKLISRGYNVNDLDSVITMQLRAEDRGNANIDSILKNKSLFDNVNPSILKSTSLFGGVNPSEQIQENIRKENPKAASSNRVTSNRAPIPNGSMQSSVSSYQSNPEYDYTWGINTEYDPTQAALAKNADKYGAYTWNDFYKQNKEWLDKEGLNNIDAYNKYMQDYYNDWTTGRISDADKAAIARAWYNRTNDTYRKNIASKIVGEDGKIDDKKLADYYMNEAAQAGKRNLYTDKSNNWAIGQVIRRTPNPRLVDNTEELDPELEIQDTPGGKTTIPDDPNGGGGGGDTIQKLPTWMRYAPIAGSMVGLGMVGPADYSRAEEVRRAYNYSPTLIQPRPIGDYMTYNPYDTNYQTNQLNAESAATRRAIANNANGNRGAAMASLLAADYGAQSQLGSLARNAQEYNDNLRRQVVAHNMGVNQYNSQNNMQAQSANQQALNQAKLYRAQGIQTANAMKDQIDANRAAAISQNLTGLFDNLGNLGRENFIFNQINNNRALDYGYTGINGVHAYKGNRADALLANGGYLTIKRK